jgi:hypothetical protein
VGKQSESAVSGEKKMNEIKSQIVLTEMKEDKLPVDKKTSTKNVSDGKNTGHVVNHSKYDENRDGKNSKFSHDIHNRNPCPFFVQNVDYDL